MPIYEYECTECGYQMEELQAFSDPPLKKCPKCKKNALEKMISLSSFKLEGTGWYATDYVKKPGIPPQAEAQNNPAISDNDTKDSKANGSDSSDKTVAESGSPSDPGETFKSIQKDTKKAKSKSKDA